MSAVRSAPARPKAGPRPTNRSSSALCTRCSKESPSMSVEVRVPVLGESVVEATVGAWLKREGDAVEAGEPLVQLETEKVNVDVSADAAGVLGKVQHAEGDTVQPGDVLATLEPAGARPPSSETPSDSEPAEQSEPT